MERRAFISNLISLAFAQALQAQPTRGSGNASLDTIRSTIYNLVLSRQCTCCQKSDELRLVLKKAYVPLLPTLTSEKLSPVERAQNDPGLTIMPLKKQLRDAEEMLADLAQESKQEQFVTAQRLPRGFRFGTEQEARAYNDLHPGGNIYNPDDAARAAAVPEPLQRRLRDVRGIVQLSPVGLNATASLAMVAFRTSSGSCMDETWYGFAKSGRHWHDLDWDFMGRGECA